MNSNDLTYMESVATEAMKAMITGQIKDWHLTNKTSEASWKFAQAMVQERNNIIRLMNERERAVILDKTENLVNPPSKQWQPKNGEQVWVKVFTNWSKGTYIGLDADEINHLVRESQEGGYSLYKSDKILPESEYPNKQNPIPQDTYVINRQL